MHYEHPCNETEKQALQERAEGAAPQLVFFGDAGHSNSLVALGPEDTMENYTSVHGGSPWRGPGVITTEVDPTGTRQTEYYLHDDRAWEHWRRLAQLGAAWCRTNGAFGSSGRADRYIARSRQ